MASELLKFLPKGYTVASESSPYDGSPGMFHIRKPDGGVRSEAAVYLKIAQDGCCGIMWLRSLGGFDKAKRELVTALTELAREKAKAKAWGGIILANTTNNQPEAIKYFDETPGWVKVYTFTNPRSGSVNQVWKYDTVKPVAKAEPASEPAAAVPPPTARRRPARSVGRVVE